MFQTTNQQQSKEPQIIDFYRTGHILKPSFWGYPHHGKPLLTRRNADFTAKHSDLTSRNVDLSKENVDFYPGNRECYQQKKGAEIGITYGLKENSLGSSQSRIKRDDKKYIHYLIVRIFNVRVQNCNAWFIQSSSDVKNRFPSVWTMTIVTVAFFSKRYDMAIQYISYHISIYIYV